MRGRLASRGEGGPSPSASSRPPLHNAAICNPDMLLRQRLPPAGRPTPTPPQRRPLPCCRGAAQRQRKRGACVGSPTCTRVMSTIVCVLPSFCCRLRRSPSSSTDSRHTTATSAGAGQQEQPQSGRSAALAAACAATATRLQEMLSRSEARLKRACAGCAAAAAPAVASAAAAAAAATAATAEPQEQQQRQHQQRRTRQQHSAAAAAALTRADGHHHVCVVDGAALAVGGGEGHQVLVPEGRHPLLQKERKLGRDRGRG